MHWSDLLTVLFYGACAVMWLVVSFGLIWGGARLIRDRGEFFDGAIVNIAVGIFVFTFGVFTLLLPIYVFEHPDNRPCVRYETTYQYNAATKTTMPVRYCAQYGEWVEP